MVAGWVIGLVAVSRRSPPFFADRPSGISDRIKVTMNRASPVADDPDAVAGPAPVIVRPFAPGRRICISRRKDRRGSRYSRLRRSGFLDPRAQPDPGWDQRDPQTGNLVADKGQGGELASVLSREPISCRRGALDDGNGAGFAGSWCSGSTSPSPRSPRRPTGAPPCAIHSANAGSSITVTRPRQAWMTRGYLPSSQALQLGAKAAPPEGQRRVLDHPHGRSRRLSRNGLDATPSARPRRRSRRR